ncbi:restriction endonuclease [Mycoplasma sp. CSL10137]|uniref:restriction endonuclease n=1 Tax=Mycoplasma sp. CSL10137 TaxID=2813824 RepID=UPI00197C4D76|nr:restriction endonuclease [Mycoplasma sp. CSL10137]MBN4083817.1 restriction endonuclease [Mycoplasma sp. CSL10137]
MSIYSEFLNKFDYDVRKSKDARWIDQKCTFDVVSIIADCIIEYVENEEKEEFTVSDIWRSEYSRNNVIEIFSKPDPELKASNEYDKYFGQPIKLLSYSKILSARKKNNRYFYKINDKELLKDIALRPTNALNFLYEYIVKVLKDSDLFKSFEHFFELQTKDSYKDVRNHFINFTIQNTPINKETECGRIFTKIINPLAFKLKKLGSKKGKISLKNITMNDLQYNRENWRDELIGKDKSITREEYEATLKQKNSKAYAKYKYTVNKAKKDIRKYNDRYYSSKSEVKQQTEVINATQAHHIFPQSDYPEIANYLENLIMLTPNQHFGMAHPNNNTQYVDKDFQYICLLVKCNNIMDNLKSDFIPKFYDFKKYKEVLNIGLETNEFSEVEDLDFATIINKIDYFYSDYIENNKYISLINDTKNAI